MVWAEMMSTTSTLKNDYKKPGIYYRDDYEQACKYAQEVFDKQDCVYLLEIIDDDCALVTTSRFPADSDVYKKEHIEKCCFCGKDIVVPKREYADWSKKCCHDCFEFREVYDI